MLNGARRAQSHVDMTETTSIICFLPNKGASSERHFTKRAGSNLEWNINKSGRARESESRAASVHSSMSYGYYYGLFLKVTEKKMPLT